MSELTPGRPDRVIAALYAPEQPARIRVNVDLTRAEDSARRRVPFEDCDRPPRIGEFVDACDLLEHLEATAEVVGVDELARAVRIAIDWTTVRHAATEGTA